MHTVRKDVISRFFGFYNPEQELQEHPTNLVVALVATGVQSGILGIIKKKMFWFSVHILAFVGINTALMKEYNSKFALRLLYTPKNNYFFAI